jgi:hypothetical protein
MLRFSESLSGDVRPIGMRDFTFSAYRRYLGAIKSAYPFNLRVDEYFASEPRPQAFCIIRHDVDRRPRKALHMAKMESSMDIRATYYFRAKPHVFKPDIIKAIARMGHEIGYHYESLCDARGDMHAALNDFDENLAKFRKWVPVNTVAMHGRPLSPFDSRELWRSSDRKKLLLEHHQILGEVYLDIDYSNIAYLTDTGRNWSPWRANLRDRVDSMALPTLQGGEDLLQFLRSKTSSRVLLQVHPERWAESFPEYLLSFGMDCAINGIKKLIKEGN